MSDLPDPPKTAVLQQRLGALVMKTWDMHMVHRPTPKMGTWQRMSDAESTIDYTCWASFDALGHPTQLSIPGSVEGLGRFIPLAQEMEARDHPCWWMQLQYRPHELGSPEASKGQGPAKIGCQGGRERRERWSRMRHMSRRSRILGY